MLIFVYLAMSTKNSNIWVTLKALENNVQLKKKMKICANFKVTKMLVLATSFQFCGDLSMLLQKPWGLTPRPVYPK